MPRVADMVAVGGAMLAWLILTVMPSSGGLVLMLAGVLWWGPVLLAVTTFVSWPITQHRPSRGARPARVARARTSEIRRQAEFTQALARLQSAVTIGAHQQDMSQLAEIDRLLTRLKATGHLSPQLERELWLFAQRNAESLADFSARPGHQPAAPGRPRQHRRRQPPPTTTTPATRSAR